LNKTLSSNKWW